MRILYLIPGDALGGAELRTFGLCLKMQELGHSVVVACGPGDVLKILEQMQINHTVIPIRNFKFDVFGLMLSAYRMGKIMKAYRIQIVVTSRRGIALYVSILSKFLPIIHIYMNVCIFSNKPWLRFNADFTIANSQAALENATKYIGLNAKMSKVIYRGLDIPKRKLTCSESRSYLGLSDDVFVIGACSRLVKGKGIDILIKAFVPTYQRNKKLKLVVVGDGPERKNLEMLARSSGIPYNTIIFLGWCKDVWKILPAINIFVCPSESESMPNSMLEAAACGAALVGTNVGGICEVIKNNWNGYIVSYGNVDELAGVLNSLVSCHDKRNLMGKRAKRFVQMKFSSRREAQEHEKIYKLLLSQYQAKHVRNPSN